MRKFATIKTSIWEDADYLKLTAQAKLLYQFLLEQADLTLCGAIPLREGRWLGPLGFAPRVYLTELEQSRFLVADRDHEELWVRTFMRHGQVWGKGIKGAQNSLDSVHSPKIRAALAEEYPDLADEWDLGTLPGTLSNEGCDPPSSDPPSDPPSDQRETRYGKRETGKGKRETRDLTVSASPHPAVPAGVLVGDDDVLTVTASGMAPSPVVRNGKAKPRSAAGDLGTCPKCEQGTIRQLGKFLGCSNRQCGAVVPIEEYLAALPPEDDAASNSHHAPIPVSPTADPITTEERS